MTVDELAQRRANNARRVAGARRHTQPQPEPEVIIPGDLGLIVEDLRQIQGMTEEVMAEALALDDRDITAAVGALTVHVADVVKTAERTLEGGGE